MSIDFQDVSNIFQDICWVVFLVILQSNYCQWLVPKQKDPHHCSSWHLLHKPSNPPWTNASKISQNRINFRFKIRTTLVRTTLMSHDYNDAQLTWNKVWCQKFSLLLLIIDCISDETMILVDWSLPKLYCNANANWNVVQSHFCHTCFVVAVCLTF